MTQIKITYTEEFRAKCFNNLRFAMDIRLLISAMDSQRHNVVRYYLEELLEDSELYIESKITDEDSKKVANNKIYAHKIRQEIYNEYMELLTNELDKEDARKTRVL